MCKAACKVGCGCKRGDVRDEASGKCIPQKLCGVIPMKSADEDDDLGRWGGWNGAAAQAAAMAISGFSGGTLNGPSSGGYSPGLRNYNAPIVRLANDEDDDMGDWF